jgi:alkylation response protein AidB-like acyl-CoA dehydrogenase
VRVALSEEQLALRDELRRYLNTELLTPETRKELGHGTSYHYSGEAYKNVIRKMGADGWLGMGWPEEYGGRGGSFIEHYIFIDECRRADAPVPFVTINTIGPTLMRFGTSEQKERFLRPILRGEIEFAIGYTEPNAGTDLASLKTRAVRDGDSYVVNGQKVFTTHANIADYIWLACRTNPEVAKHKGISILIVPTDAPGVKITPFDMIDDHRSNAVYFEDVRVSADAIVGGENDGWRLITTQLNHERNALACSGKPEELLERVIAWARETRSGDGARVIDRPWVQLILARCRAKLEALRLLNWRLAWELTTAHLNAADASVVKVFGTETFVEVYRAMMEVLGEAGVLKVGSSGAALNGLIEQMYRWAYINTFGGGANEVQREIIATIGLGMPRTGR